MYDALLLGVGRYMIPIPRAIWRRQVARAGPRIKAALGFMTPEHHLVRNFVVVELPLAAKPLSPEYISQKLNLPVARVTAILEELERNLTFLFRNPEGAVAWAYPVTSDQTPHRVTFSTGEQINAA
jgi:hypothetical protein